MMTYRKMILIQKMHTSGVFRFDDTINDMDFFARFKYTKLIGALFIKVKNLSNCGELSLCLNY